MLPAISQPVLYGLRQYFDLVAHTDGVLDIDLEGYACPGCFVELTGDGHSLHDFPAHMLLDQYQDDVNLAIYAQAEKCLRRLDAFATCLVQHGASGRSGLPCSIQDVLGAFVLYYDDL